MKKQGFVANYTQILIDKLRQGHVERANVIIVSGIPGSGKTKLTDSLTKMLSSEGLPVASFKTPGPIADQVKFSTSKFI